MEVIVLRYVSHQNRIWTISHELTSFLLCGTTTWIAITTILDIIQLEKLESLSHDPRRYFSLSLATYFSYSFGYIVILWPVTQTFTHLMFIYHSIRRVGAIILHMRSSFIIIVLLLNWTLLTDQRKDDQMQCYHKDGLHYHRIHHVVRFHVSIAFGYVHLRTKAEFRWNGGTYVGTIFHTHFQ